MLITTFPAPFGVSEMSWAAPSVMGIVPEFVPELVASTKSLRPDEEIFPVEEPLPTTTYPDPLGLRVMAAWEALVAIDIAPAKLVAVESRVPVSSGTVRTPDVPEPRNFRVTFAADPDAWYLYMVMSEHPSFAMPGSDRVLSNLKT